MTMGEGGQPDQTVEAYLQARCDELAQDLNGYAGQLMQDLNQEMIRGREELMALACGEQVHRPQHIIRLRVKEGPCSQSEFMLTQTPTQSEFIVGRSTGKKVRDTGVSLSQDETVSTIHGKIICCANKVLYEDVGSSNHSRINEVQIPDRSPTVIKTGDQLKVGEVVLEVDIETIEPDTKTHAASAD